MKRSLLFFLLFFGVACLVFAKQVDQNSARTVAQNYYANMALDMEGSDLQLVYTCTVSTTDDFKLKNSLYYVFNNGNENGFIIISGDDRAAPVLGYTLKGNFDESELPPNVKKWLEGYKKDIWYAIENKVDPPAAVAENWESLLNGTDNTRSVTAVDPLMSTIWNQSPYYNDLCPGGSVSGCVATAMAQIMKYWNHPAQGAGFHSYDHQTYGTISANFGGTSYEWASMPNDVQSSNNAVATFMYHCGVSVDMNYSPQVSGAYVITDQSPVQHCSEYAFRNYFGYDNSMQGLQRSNYSTSQWVQMLKDDLDAGRPILYAGFGSGGGHAFVCDGYDANSFFHFNWGWGGYYDGFFSIDALDPGGTGTGGGTGGYNSGHQAILNLKPIDGGGGGTDFNLALYEGLSFSANPLSYGQPFSVHSNIINNGNGDYSGDYCAAVLDNSLAFIDFVEVKTGYTLTGGGYYYTDGLDFESSGLFTMLPGSYFIGIYYRPTGGDWTLVGDGSYTNLVAFEVYFENDLEVYDEITVNVGNNITQGQPIKVHTSVANTGASDFNGTLDISLYYLDGSFAETIEAKDNMSLESGYFYSDGLDFETNGITVEPGSYLLALLYHPGTDWELGGSYYYTNPIRVTVQAPSVEGDSYENNDTEAAAYNFSVDFNGTNGEVETTGSNSHTGEDLDYYMVTVPAGYDYTFDVRAHDSYNSGNGQTYTNDVLWAYKTSSDWSDAYDDVMASTFEVKNGGSVYFLAAPYFAGGTGTYLLDVNITRDVAGIQDITDSDNFRVYPNPATNQVNIDLTGNIEIDEVTMYDMAGKEILKVAVSGRLQKHINIPLDGVRTGAYFLVIKSENEKWQTKILKTR